MTAPNTSAYVEAISAAGNAVAECVRSEEARRHHIDHRALNAALDAWWLLIDDPPPCVDGCDAPHPLSCANCCTVTAEMLGHIEAVEAITDLPSTSATWRKRLGAAPAEADVALRDAAEAMVQEMDRWGYTNAALEPLRAALAPADIAPEEQA